MIFTEFIWIYHRREDDDEEELLPEAKRGITYQVPRWRTVFMLDSRVHINDRDVLVFLQALELFKRNSYCSSWIKHYFSSAPFSNIQEDLVWTSLGFIDSHPVALGRHLLDYILFTVL